MLQWFARNQETFAKWSQVVSAAAQVIAVAIGGFWAYHLHAITGESELVLRHFVWNTTLTMTPGRRARWACVQ
ncbi:hypothetical protein, partial [Burkholderia vietnamiensis]|uniref:hypothetical protein n=1 Tax=Burkholderia vietnamiensis TaxID=60552 RepID=UPI000A6C678F